MTKLRDTIQSDKVQYALACGRLCIVPKGSQLVQTVNGGFERMEHPGLSLVSEGEFRQNGITREFDPSNPKDKKIIDTVDQFMIENPEVVNLPTVKLTKMTGPQLGAPIPRMDQMDPRELFEAIKLTRVSAEDCMRYELQKDEPREDILDMLEKVYEKQSEAAQDRAEATVQL